MKKYFYIGLLFLSSCGCFEDKKCSTSGDFISDTMHINKSDDKKTALQKACEYAYFEGQKDALSGDVRIKFDNESDKWIWIKSPWNGGTSPIFIPTSENNKK